MLKKSLATGLSGLFFLPLAAHAKLDFSGYIETEVHIYQQTGLFEDQKSHLISVAVEPELYWESDDENQSISFKVFGRTSDEDGNRDHADIRELYYSYAGNGWQIQAGINKVFWGVTEAAHLVDIVNQTDNVESITGEEKLGQMMVSLGLEQDWGNLDLFILPGFRERHFPTGPERFQIGNEATKTAIDIDGHNAVYEDEDEEDHVDYAARWSHYFGDLDVGVSYFSGTNRAPIPVIGKADLGSTPPTVEEFAPYYEQLDQLGLELQYIWESWAFKFEGASKQLESGDYSEAVAGFEYTLSDVNFTGIDVGFIFEYLWNDRDSVSIRNPSLKALGLPTTTPLPANVEAAAIIEGNFLSPLEDDVFLGTRFTMNDAASTDFIAGVIVDTSDNTMSGKFEGGTRVGDDIRLTLNLYFYTNVDERSALYSFRKDDQIEAKVAWYF